VIQSQQYFSGASNYKVHQCTAIANAGSSIAHGISFEGTTSGFDIRDNTALAHIGTVLSRLSTATVIMAESNAA